INSSLGVETTVVFEFPSITQNGRPLKDSVTLQADATVSEVNIPLENYKVDLTTTTKHFNELPVNFSVKVTFPVTLPPTSGSMNLNIGLQNFKYSRIHGYFGYNELIIQSDTIKIDIFKKNPKYYMDRFYFNNPKLTVHYKNSYGVPTTFCFTNLDSYMKTTGQIMDIMTGNPNFPMSEANPYMLTSSSNYQQEAEDSIELNKHNSNLDQIVPNRPEWVHFTAKAATNPSNPTHNNFITDESRLQTRIMVEFPLWGYLYNFWYVDTLNLDLSNIATNYPISRAALMLNLNNGLPVEAFAQLYLADENYQILDSLIRTDDQLVLEAAPLDSNGRVRERVSTKTKLELTSSQIADLKTTKHVLVRLTANTDNAFQGKLMKIYRDYGITLHVGAEVDLDIHGNIDDLLNDNSDKNITINTK
ncbi:MAG: hypothetical protein HUK15_08355, partial [Bacteroidales bacterium]|nr:hypothetical protein [Bacteroidales bacterium]